MFLRILKLARVFEKLAQYDPDYIDRLSKKNPYPFSSWFGPDGRTYIPFTISQEHIQESSSKKYIEKVLAEKGWIVTDYVGGYATKNGKTVRIGKLLQAIQKEYKQDHEEELRKLTNENAEPYQKDIVIMRQKKEKDWVDELIKDFSTDPVRQTKKAGEKSIVFSQNPQDVATMSTGRGWTSCMNLDGGEHREDVFCEVERGGFVAYLINSADLEIKQPFARVHIRRFMDVHGNNIAVPEDTVYGENVPGFLETVKNWIKEKQGNIQPGRYSRIGGDWSDTFDNGTQEFGEKGEAQTIPQLLETIQSTEIPGAKYTVYRVEDTLEDYFDDSNVSLNRDFLNYEEAERYKNSLEMSDIVYMQEELAYQILQDTDMSEEEIDNKIANRFSIRKYDMDLTDSIKLKAIQKLISSPNLTPEQVKLVAAYISNDVGEESVSFKTLVKNYPNSFSEKEIKELSIREISESLKKLPPEKAEAYKKMLLSQAIENIDNFIDNLPIKENLGNTPDFVIISKFNSIISYIQEFSSQLYESEIQKLANIPEKLKGKINDATLRYILSDINNIFAIKQADTPTVQNFYRKYLPKLEDLNNLRDITRTLYSIKSLKENGKEYIPAIKEKIEQVKTRYNQTEGFTKKVLTKILSSLLHTLCIIDPSYGDPQKYKFYH